MKAKHQGWKECKKEWKEIFPPDENINLRDSSTFSHNNTAFPFNRPQSQRPFTISFQVSLMQFVHWSMNNCRPTFVSCFQKLWTSWRQYLLQIQENVSGSLERFKFRATSITFNMADIAKNQPRKQSCTIHDQKLARIPTIFDCICE